MWEERASWATAIISISGNTINRQQPQQQISVDKELHIQVRAYTTITNRSTMLLVYRAAGSRTVG
jgi:hypothetical protein